MSGTRNMVALEEMPIPGTYDVTRKLRCVATGRYIENNINFKRLELTRMVIVKNSIWAVESQNKIVIMDVTTGAMQYRIPLPHAAGITVFRDKMYVYTNSELFEVEDNDNDTKGLRRVAVCPHEIFCLEIVRRDDYELTFIVESRCGQIVKVQGFDLRCRCTVLKGHGHFLCGVFGAHVFIYCLESNDIIDWRNDVIERRFPPFDNELLGRFRMDFDGTIYYCSWDDIDLPWRIERLCAVTGNRRGIDSDSNHIFLVPCVGFVPFYEVR